MVYESDFYTTRRPYSRPLVSSYSVTDRPVTIPLSSIIQLRSAPHMPYVAHKRLVTIVHTPIHTVYHAGALIPVRVHARVRPSVLAAEINRIRNLPRPTSVSYLEKYLNSKDHIYFDDEAREIRARVDSLLRRVHVFVPRAVASDFAEEIVPERMRSGDYVRRLISGKNNAKKDAEPVSWYEIPERGNFSNLACVKYVAGKPQSVRKPYFKVADLRPSDIKNDVNLLSYYSKNRQAAATASPDHPMTERELRKARALEPDNTEAAQKKAPKVEKEQESKPEKKRASKKEAAPTPVVEPAEKVELEPVKEAEPKVEAEKKPKPVKKPEPVPEPVKEPEPVPEPVKEPEPVPEPVKEPEPVPEPVKEPEPIPETVKEPEPVPEPVKEPEPIPEPVKQPEPIPEPVKEEKLPEPVPEPTPEETQPVVEAAEPQQAAPESKPDASSEAQASENVEAVSETEKNTEESQADEKVKIEKEEALKRVEQYLAKAAEEARTEEERKRNSDEERAKLELEELKAWEALQAAQERAEHIDEILEQESAEAQRKAQEAKIEADRLETEKVLEAERLLAQQKVAALLIEQERMVIEEHLEEVRQQEEKEERLANVTFGDVDEVKDVDCSRDDPLTSEVTDQEREEKPYELITEDDTRIEEENAQEVEQFELNEDPFAEEPEGEQSKAQTGANAVEDTPKVEEITSGGEESFEWGDSDA